MSYIFATLEPVAILQGARGRGEDAVELVFLLLPDQFLLLYILFSLDLQ